MCSINCSGGCRECAPEEHAQADLEPVVKEHGFYDTLGGLALDCPDPILKRMLLDLSCHGSYLLPRKKRVYQVTVSKGNIQYSGVPAEVSVIEVTEE